jgi:hypothetical protein
VEGSCEHDTEPLGSIEGRELLDYVSVSFSRKALLHVVS